MGRRRLYAAFESVGGVRVATDELHRRHDRAAGVEVAMGPKRRDLLEVA